MCPSSRSKEGIPRGEDERLLDVLGTYPTKLPGVKNWSLGKNLSGDTSLDDALVCESDGRGEIDAHVTHPYRRDTAGEYYRPLVERSAPVSYEF